MHTSNPPTRVDHSWYYVRAGERHGPVTTAMLLEMLSWGHIGPDTLVWTIGKDGWKAVRDVEALRTAARSETIAGPPPVPPNAYTPHLDVSRTMVPPVPPSLRHSAEIDHISPAQVWAGPGAPDTAPRPLLEHVSGAPGVVQGSLPGTVCPESSAPRPWRRWCARLTDLFVAGTMVGIVIEILAPTSGFDPQPMGWQLLATFLLVPYDAFWAALAVRSPGKALFNIHVRTSSGEQLGWEKAAGRAGRLILSGLGLGLPLVSSITSLVQYGKLTGEGATSYDRKGGFVVTYGELSSMRRVGILIALLIVFGSMIAGAVPSSDAGEPALWPTQSGNATSGGYSIRPYAIGSPGTVRALASHEGAYGAAANLGRDGIDRNVLSELLGDVQPYRESMWRGDSDTSHELTDA